MKPRSATLAGALLLAGGCDTPQPVEAPPASASPAAVEAPRDRLAPGELEVGTELAFGLQLPKVVKVERRFDDAVHASGVVAAETLANFIRQRVAVAGVEIGAAKTVFPRARVREGDGKVLMIEVVRGAGERTQLVVRDVTPPQHPPGATPAEMWRRAGMTDDGKGVAPDSNR